MEKNDRGSIARVTLQSIADEAKTSVASVSAVLSNRHIERRIGPATVEKIRTIAAKLGYLPNIEARRLRRGDSGATNIVVAFVTSYEAPFNIANQFVHALRTGVSVPGESRRPRSFSLAIKLFQPGRLKELQGLESGDHFNAAIIANSAPIDDQYLSRTHLPYPVVLANRSISHYSCVIEDPKTGAVAAEILLKGNRRTNLVVLHGTPITHATQTRVDSFIAATVRLIGRPAKAIAAHNLSDRGGFDAVFKFLDSGGKADGLYVVSDNLALGAYHAITRRNLNIPNDIAVVGTGDQEAAAFFAPPLTWVGAPRALVGDEVSRLLLSQLDNPGKPPVSSVIPLRTLLRESTGHRSEF